VSCGSFDARFEAWLPPGSYVLGAYSEFADKELFEGELIPDRTITLSSDARDVDLGLLKFAPHRTQNRTRIAQAKEHGRWNDYTKHYGEKPPRWHITDARGVARDVQLADFAGKWVLVEFWGFGCRPCLKTGLPRLMKFYEDHKRDRDRFEILAVCIDPDDELKSMADVDRRLEPIIKNVWGGNRLPFPVLLDQTFQTWERFGLSGMGEILLVDPQGRLVKGDDSVLARKLEERQEKP
jgi:thiol-disulfide isomerase/thioredoxin